MRARTLRNQVVFEASTVTKDASGAPSEIWTTYTTEWAEIRPIGGREYYAAQQVASDNRWGFKIRYNQVTKLINSKHRITYDGRVFDIQGEPVNEFERNKDLIIMAIERHGN